MLLCVETRFNDQLITVSTALLSGGSNDEAYADTWEGCVCIHLQCVLLRPGSAAGRPPSATELTSMPPKWRRGLSREPIYRRLREEPPPFPKLIPVSRPFTYEATGLVILAVVEDTQNQGGPSWDLSVATAR